MSISQERWTLSANEIHKGDVGTVFTFTIKDSDTSVDISNATTLQFLLKGPGGTTTTISANMVGTGSTGSINFTSTAAHFDTSGTYKLQGVVADTSGSWHTDVYEFFVWPNIE